MAVEREIELLLKLRDEATARFKTVQGQMTTGLKAIGTAAAAAFSVYAIRNFIEKAQVAEKAEIQLAQAIKNAGDTSKATVKAMLEYSDAMQRVTTFGDEAIDQAQTMLVAMTGLTGTALQPAVKAALDLASAFDKDVSKMAEYIGKTVQGQQALKTYGIDVGNVEGAHNRLNAIVAETTRQYGGFAEMAAQTSSGQLKQLKNAFDDLQESIGIGILRSLQPLMPMMGTIIANLGKMVEIFFSGLGMMFFQVVAVVADVAGKIEEVLNFIGLTESQHFQQRAAMWRLKALEYTQTFVDAFNTVAESEGQVGIAATQAAGDTSKNWLVAAQSVEHLMSVTRLYGQGLAMVSNQEKKNIEELGYLRENEVGNWKEYTDTVLAEFQESYSRAVQFAVGLTQTLQGVIQAAFQGTVTSVKDALKQILNSIITMIEGMIVAAAAAMWAKGVFMFGSNIPGDIASIAIATAALEAARAIVNSFEVGGQIPGGGAFIAGTSNQAVPVIVHGGETIRNEYQERRLQDRLATGGGGQNVTLNFYGPVAGEEQLFRMLKKRLRQTGMTVDKLMQNNRNSVKLA